MYRIPPIGYYLMIAFLLAFACQKAERINPFPQEEIPAISQISPDSNSFIAMFRDSIKVGFRLADKEGLERFKVNKTIFDRDGQIVEGPLEFMDQGLSGEVALVDVNDVVGDYAPFSTIKYDCEVADIAGATAMAIFYVSVVRDTTRLEPFEVKYFEERSLKNLAGGQDHGYNFTSESYFPRTGGQALEIDIEELSQGETFSASLRSPNNAILGLDSVFVMTDASRLNFEEATYTTISQAFAAGELFFSQTPRLQENDYVIVRLIKAPDPQFALMRILEVKDSLGLEGDLIRFDYKLSRGE